MTGRVEKGWGVKVSGLEGWRVSGFDGSRVVGFEFWSCFLWSCGAAELYIPKKIRKPHVSEFKGSRIPVFDFFPGFEFFEGCCRFESSGFEGSRVLGF